MTQFDPFDPAFKSGVHAYYTTLRTAEPITRVSTPDGDSWLITRYDDVMAAVKDERFIKNASSLLSPEEAEAMAGQPEAMKLISQQMLYMDGADHRRLRRLVEQAFTPRAIQSFEAHLKQRAEELLAAAKERETFDIVNDYALPLTFSLLSDILGIPAEDQEKVQKWVQTLMQNIGRIQGTAKLRVLRSLEQCSQYFKALYSSKSTDDNDLIAQLLKADFGDQPLTESELLAMSFLFITAGYETTVHLIGNSVLALVEQPELWDDLKRNPDLLPQAIEEFLRYDGPVETSTPRYAREDFEFGGTQFKRGDLVTLVFTSANRDGERFENPEKIDFRRPENRHLAFGYGAHYCVGAPLARLEMHVALSALLKHYDRLELAVAKEDVRWRLGMLMRGLEVLPVRRSLALA